MNHAELLDCTLRDGAYLLEKKFGDNNIKGIIKGLVDTRVDFIEIGFLQDEGFGIGKTVYKSANDARQFIPDDRKVSEFAVLADFSRYSIENLERCSGESFTVVRECFFKEERFKALEVCKKIKNLGYKLFIQPVDILGYSDIELIEFLQNVNDIEPYCLSIVDTFGSMYADDLQRIFSLIDHNLICTSRIGFHSHNNMQMSSALSQEFIKMAHGKREVVIDTTISGMGRGAGNTPTELVAQYLVQKQGYHYNIDALLDTIDNYMDNIKSKCTWGYSTPYFIAGCYSAHVNNISYLTQKNSIRSKDIRYILNKIGATIRKRYDYDLLENIYMEYLASEINDADALEYLKNALKNRVVVMIVPGSTSLKYKDEINKYIEQNNAIVLAINFLPKGIVADYVYFSNMKRFSYWNNKDNLKGIRKIVTSNINTDDNSIVINFSRLIKCGWKHVDNSALMVLRLLDFIPVHSIAIAGLDGYEYKSYGSNYAMVDMELADPQDNAFELNKEIEDMLNDFVKTRKQNTQIEFITNSRFSKVFEV